MNLVLDTVCAKYFVCNKDYHIKRLNKKHMYTFHLRTFVSKNNDIKVSKSNMLFKIPNYASPLPILCEDINVL